MGFLNVSQFDLFFYSGSGFPIDNSGNSSNNGSKGSNKPPRNLGDKSICGEFDVQYNGGGQLARFANTPSADACRAHCTQNADCQYWTWQGGKRSKR